VADPDGQRVVAWLAARDDHDALAGKEAELLQSLRPVDPRRINEPVHGVCSPRLGLLEGQERLSVHGSR
jgi:hypothetical protein